jgi:hypothetical protein
MKRFRLICLTLAVAWATTASATSMMPLDLKALMSRADRVVLGTVVSSESRWTSAHDAIYTESVVRVERAYKGVLKVGQTVTVRREGGSVDGIGMRVYGAAALDAGDEAVLFLEERAGATWVVGMSQGKWRVTLENGKKMVRADLSGIAFVHPGPTALPSPRALTDVERDLRAMKLELERSGQ